MALPVTHILVPMLLVETYRRFISKKQFSKWFVFLTGVFGALPDIDFLASWLVTGTFDATWHRNITHSLVFPISMLIAALIIFLVCEGRIVRSCRAMKTACVSLTVAALGLASHTLLDGLNGLTQWFYPWMISVNLPNIIPETIHAAILDGILLFIWLLYDYIE